MSTFYDLKQISSPLADHLASLGFREMTPIQHAALPILLEGSDLVMQGATGTGKTLAYAIPALLSIQPQRPAPQVLILTPTRELAEQVTQVLRRLSAGFSQIRIIALYGGEPLGPQAEALARGAQILVGTPGRVEDHLSKKSFDPASLSQLLLDEADKMLELGFSEAILRIFQKAHNLRQRVLVSATFPRQIEKLAATILIDPQEIRLIDDRPDIQESACIATDKHEALDLLLRAYRPASALLFCNTRQEAICVAQRLFGAGHAICFLHGKLDQGERHEALIRLQHGSARILVATDLASRGLDIPEVDLVIHYDLPQDQTLYTHRIGRTGRAGKSGLSVAIVHDHETAALGRIAPHITIQHADASQNPQPQPLQSNLTTLVLSGGKQQKLSAGDIVGTLCKAYHLRQEAIGKITITSRRAYVTLPQAMAEKIAGLQRIQIKKQRLAVWTLI
jgi:ATP-independent RNA helicase DbpA